MAFISRDVADYIKIIQNPSIGLRMINKQKKRALCSNCSKSGHNNRSTKCETNILMKKRLIEQIKENILQKPVSSTTDNDIKFISEKLKISYNMCKSLYRQIPQGELMGREINLTQYIHELNKKILFCGICAMTVFPVHDNIPKKWKGETVCDKCWNNQRETREKIYTLIDIYRPPQCVLCFRKRTGCERFHFDHVNIFDKNADICSMVNEGSDIKQIYAEIDKCQRLCIECHNIITDLEYRTGFIKIKTQLAKQEDCDEKRKALMEYKERYHRIFTSLQKELRVELIFLRNKKSNPLM